MTPIHNLILLGLIVGIYSGIMGLGGGTIMIPIMVLALGFTQQKAVTTSLAVMIPPVTLLGVLKYYREGQVDVRTAAWIAVGVVFGTLVGAVITGWIVKHFGDARLKLLFALILTYISGYMLFQTLGKQHLVRSMLFAGVLVLVSFLFFTAVKWYDARSAPPTQSAPTKPA